MKSGHFQTYQALAITTLSAHAQFLTNNHKDNWWDANRYKKGQKPWMRKFHASMAMIKLNWHDKFTTFDSVKNHSYFYPPKISNVHSFRAVQATTWQERAIHGPEEKLLHIIIHSVSNRQLLDMLKSGWLSPQIADVDCRGKAEEWNHTYSVARWGVDSPSAKVLVPAVVVSLLENFSNDHEVPWHHTKIPKFSQKQIQVSYNNSET